MISYHIKQNSIRHLHPPSFKYHSILNEQTHNFPPVGPTFSDAATMESSEDLELLHAENTPREIPRSRSLKLSIALVP